MESEEGKGTCITFYLPTATKEFNEPRSKLPPMKRVALFLRPKAVKQRKHESAHVSFCDTVRSTGFSKQTIKGSNTRIVERSIKQLREDSFIDNLSVLPKARDEPYNPV